MGFPTPAVHKVRDVLATVQDVPAAKDGSPAFACLDLTFIQADGEDAHITVFFDRPEDMERAHAIAAAITLSQSPLADAAE